MIRQRKIELLAPAKNLECGIAAVDHGADAIYIGAPRFGARAAARFMRAFYHYLLFEQYGPIIIVGDKVYEATESQDMSRNSVDEVVEYLDKELLDSYVKHFYKRISWST